MSNAGGGVPPTGGGGGGGSTPAGTRFTQEAQDISAQLVAQERALRELNLSIKQASRQLASRFTGFINPVVRLEDSIRRMDATNREALKLGTTTKKLSENIAKNSDILERGRVSI